MALFAMHIEDGILPWSACLAYVALTVAFLYPAVLQINRRIRENPYYKPLLAMCGVGIFVISAMHMPVPVTGSCSHPCGTPLAAIIVGPFATVLLSVIVLFFQAILLGHGGITTIGANTVSMGIAGTFAGYYLWKLIRYVKGPVWLAAGAAGLVGDLVVYLASSGELAFSLHGHASFWHQWLVFFLGYAPTQLPLAIGEAVFTAVIVQAMAIRRPDLLPGVLTDHELLKGVETA
jgi:cobalt/nickel transport system permease protein